MHPINTTNNTSILLQNLNQNQKPKKEQPKKNEKPRNEDSEDTMSDMDEIEEAPDEKEYINPKKQKASL